MGERHHSRSQWRIVFALLNRVVVEPDERPPLPWVTLLLLGVLLALAPYALTFTPFQGIYTAGVYEAPYDTDPRHALRVALVVFGLCATAAASLEGVVLVRGRPALPSILTFAAAWFACAVLGWRSFPYWVTGVYAAYSGRAPHPDLDPKALIPMTWLGELWRLGVLALYPLAVVIVPAAIVASILLLRRRAYASSAVPVVCAAIGLIFLFFLSPGYLGWLMD